MVIVGEACGFEEVGRRRSSLQPLRAIARPLLERPTRRAAPHTPAPHTPTPPLPFLRNRSRLRDELEAHARATTPPKQEPGGWTRARWTACARPRRRPPPSSASASTPSSLPSRRSAKSVRARRRCGRARELASSSSTRASRYSPALRLRLGRHLATPADPRSDRTTSPTPTPTTVGNFSRDEQLRIAALAAAGAPLGYYLGEREQAASRACFLNVCAPCCSIDDRGSSTDLAHARACSHFQKNNPPKQKNNRLALPPARPVGALWRLLPRHGGPRARAAGVGGAPHGRVAQRRRGGAAPGDAAGEVTTEALSFE